LAGQAAPWSPVTLQANPPALHAPAARAAVAAASQAVRGAGTAPPIRARHVSRAERAVV